jgi:hypothetical protein
MGKTPPLFLALTSNRLWGVPRFERRLTPPASRPPRIPARVGARDSFFIPDFSARRLFKNLRLQLSAKSGREVRCAGLGAGSNHCSKSRSLQTNGFIVTRNGYYLSRRSSWCGEVAGNAIERSPEGPSGTLASLGVSACIFVFNLVRIDQSTQYGKR